MVDAANHTTPTVNGLGKPIPTLERGWHFGGNSYIEFPNSDGIVFNSDFTLVFWLKLDVDSGKNIGLIHKFAP